MKQFIQKYATQILGILNGFDRMVFRGTLRQLSQPDGILTYLACKGILYKDFASHAEDVTNRLRRATEERCQKLGVETRYLGVREINKEELAREIATQNNITNGLICVLGAVETCRSFEVRRDGEKKQQHIVAGQRKCLHYYYYLIDPRFGFMSIRLQTWFPFSVQICINGREWLCREMEQKGLAHERRDNCLTWVEDFQQAQALLDRQQQTNWPQELARLAQEVHPLFDELFTGDFEASYYWSLAQSEWATDITFKEGAMLKRLYPMLVRHGMSTLSSPDVMRFLSKRLCAGGRIRKDFEGEVQSSAKERQEGVRIKHMVNANSVKAYDKAYSERGSVLRIETTVNRPGEFRVYRGKEGGKADEKAWMRMRKGVADIYHRSEVCQKVNERYLDALSSVDDSTQLQEVLRRVVVPTQWKGKRVRSMRPFDPEDFALLEAVGRGEFTINGLRNRELHPYLFTSEAGSTEEMKRRSAQVTRKLRMLRAHGILRKVPHSHRYQVTAFGRQLITALLTARDTPIRQLLPSDLLQAA